FHHHHHRRVPPRVPSPSTHTPSISLVARAPPQRRIMSQRDHGLSESVAVVPVPTSPRKRQKTGKEEDSDSKQSSPNKQSPAMSTDAASPSGPLATSTTPPPDNKVEMTIRSQPQVEIKPASPRSVQQGADDANEDAESSMEIEDDIATQDVPVGGADGSADSPPVIAIDDEDDDDDLTTRAMQFEYTAETYFRQFPFSGHVDHVGAAHNIAQHFQGGGPIDGTVLPQVAVWLDNLPDQPEQRVSYFTGKVTFWDEMYTIVNRVLSRRTHFGANFCDESQTEEEILASFLGAYLRTCARLLQADAESLQQSCSSESYVWPIVSYRHIRLLVNILRQERTPVFHLLNKEYGADTAGMGLQLLHTFLEAEGLRHLFSFADHACDKAPPAMHNYIAIWVPQLLDATGWQLFATSNAVSVISMSQFYRDILHFFRRYNTSLQNPSKVADTGQTKDIINNFSQLLHDLCAWDPEIADELVQEMLDFGDPESPTKSSPVDQVQINRDTYYSEPKIFPALVKHGWKFRLLRKYVVKGRMELRVSSIGTMDTALVDIWREFNEKPLSVKHPVMQYLADFLLHERVVDYIISVDSHPQLISRSGNIVGFLVVTGRYSESQTDAIWNTVSNSSDPRVVSATMTMLRSIVNLMPYSDLLYFLRKLYDLPIESYTLDIVQFIQELASKISNDTWKDTDVRARPWNVCIRVMQDVPLYQDTPKLSMSLHHKASDQLRVSSNLLGPDERCEIYRQCAAHIASRSTKATGSVHAILAIITATNFRDAPFFEENPTVARQILEEICAFIDSLDSFVLESPQGFAMQYRLEVLSLMINGAQKAVPTDLYQKLWDHLVGKYARTTQLRDLAWTRIRAAMKENPNSDFCEQLVSIYIPELEPQYYTYGLYEFVGAYKFPTTRRVIETPEGKEELLQIRGADLLWSIIHSAPPGTIEDNTAKLLADRYLELDETNGITLHEVEQAHVALVEQCMHELLSTYKVLRNKVPADEGQMDVVLADSVKEQKERQFTRTVLFLKLLLVSVRTRPQFNRSRRTDSKVGPLDDVMLPEGDVVEIRYQTPSAMNSIVVGSNNTLQDVYRRICLTTGFSKFNMFFQGQRLDVAERGSEKVGDMDLSKQPILVQKVLGSEESLHVPDTSGPCSVFETALLNRFEELFACMDGDDSMSATLYDLLLCFPVPWRIAESVTTGAISADELFPPASHYQANYAANILQRRLDQQLHENTVDDKFLANAVRLLDQALVNPSLDIDSSSTHRSLAGTLVQVFVRFLKERPSTEVSSSYFSNEVELVSRLIELLSKMLQTESMQVALAAFAAILEASLHSRPVWAAFMEHPKVPYLHKLLLLDFPNPEWREETAKIISSVCGGGLSESSALTEADTAIGFWNQISHVLPHAAKLPNQSEQLLKIADQVFRKKDEHDRDESTLRSYLTAWSDILLSHHHAEVVGRGEIDFVVLGFSKLLLSCISSLKSLKKPLNAGQLIEKIWNRFLFVPKVIDLEDPATDMQLPVLDSQTRKELFDLVLALAEDRPSYKRLLELGSELEINETDSTPRPFEFDRQEAIRSPTGYLGLNNPRAICYMNSLLAQLFMNVNFRKFMLGINVADSAAPQRLLRETQKLFANMQNSYRKWADPEPFAACVRVPDGGSIDINIQMDADEFYNLLFDQWEAQMISPRVKEQFRSFYGGQTVNQIKSKECEHVSERLESFFVVQCDVQGKSSLIESLQAFVEGDVMEGENKYKCESCGGKLVDAVKRTCLKDVPDNLIFHLKRFDFDLVTLSRAKINEYFDFPMAIDVSPFKVDHLSDPLKPRQEDWFDLVGILIHQGSSEAGHYYSYIRSRPCPPDTGSEWNEFNDRDVEAFDPQYIMPRAFGGWIDQYQRQLKNFSAYMLFYQRRSAIEKDNNEYSDSLRSGPVKVPVPPDMDEKISEDNKNCIREYTMYDPHHTKFVRQILANVHKINHGTCSEDHEQETQALYVVLEHLFQILIRVRNPENFEETLLQLRKSALSCSTCCIASLKWLAYHETPLRNMLILCDDPKVRSLSRTFLIDCLRFLRGHDQAAYGLVIDSVDSDNDTEPVAHSPGILSEIVSQMRLVAENSVLSIRNWDELYLTLIQIIGLGNDETALILDEGLLLFCLHVFCLPVSRPLQQRYPEMWRVTEKKRRGYNRMTEFVYMLLSRIDPGAGPVTNTSNRVDLFDRDTGKFTISQEEKRWLFFWFDDNRAFAALDKMLETFDQHKTEVFYPGEILKLMMQWDDMSYHQRLFITVYEGIVHLGPPTSDPYVRAALAFCESSIHTNYVESVAEAVAKATAKSEKDGGDAAIYVFMGLLFAKNEGIPVGSVDVFFYRLCLYWARRIANSLLIFDEERVRRKTAKYFEELLAKFKDEEIDEDTLQMKYKTIRSLVNELLIRIEDEQRNGTSRSYMQPMIQTCSLLAAALRKLHEDENSDLKQFKHDGDPGLFQYYDALESQLSNWPFEEGTPQSGVDFDQSDYGSESDADDFHGM
ncbi:hypothetical protein CC80DRAFT_574639, partial [Byssothecium circinans]